jgi:uncharacterized protein (TIGR00369 family)
MSADRFVPLTNDGWGIESSCFVCEPRNTTGLGIPFHHDTIDERVVATFTLDERFSGAPKYVHGGVSLAILDEAMAWATIAIAQRFAVTRETTSRFECAIEVGREHTVRARVEEVSEAQILTTAEIVRDDGRRCVTTTATFVALDLEQASRAAGEKVTGVAAEYTSTPQH